MNELIEKLNRVIDLFKNPLLQTEDTSNAIALLQVKTLMELKYELRNVATSLDSLDNWLRNKE